MLTFCIFCYTDAHLVISQYLDLWNNIKRQFVDKLLNVYYFSYCVFKCNIFDFGYKNRNYSLLFTAPWNNCSIKEKVMPYNRFSILKITRKVAIYELKRLYRGRSLGSIPLGLLPYIKPSCIVFLNIKLLFLLLKYSFFLG